MRAPHDFPPFRTPVRGYRFAARPPRADHPRPGQVARLHREVGHPADPWAVAVWVRSGDGTPWRIGYLERAVAARLGPRLDIGEELEATIVGWLPAPCGRWRRPVVRLAPGGMRQSEKTACTVSSAPSGSSRSKTAASSRRSTAHARPARRFADALSAKAGSSPTST